MSHCPRLGLDDAHCWMKLQSLVNVTYCILYRPNIMLLRRKATWEYDKRKKIPTRNCTRYDKYWCRMGVVVMGMDRNNVIEWERGGE